MRKDFDMLLRNTYFLPWGTFNANGVLSVLRQGGFGHFMLGNSLWSKSPAGWYESAFPGGYKALKEFVNRLHDNDILFTLLSYLTLIGKNDPWYIEPRPAGVIQTPATATLGDYCVVDPYSDAQRQISARLAAVADLVGADGVYLDGIEQGFAQTISNSAEKEEAIAKVAETFVTQAKSLILQVSHPIPAYKDYWCLSGERDCYYVVKRGGLFTGTRDEWTVRHISFAEQQMNAGYPGQTGWTDFAYGKTMPDGTPIEDQTPETLAKLCDWAKGHNLPIVLESTLEDIDSHPQSDELLAIFKAT